MPHIDPTARVADGARLAADVEIGPYCVVGPQVELRGGVRLLSHVNVVGATVIGERTAVYPFASLGTPPQSVKYRGSATRLVIGAECQIRELVTINTGTEDGGGVTAVGDRCFLMTATHVGHDCKLGHEVTAANGTLLAGHVTVGNFALFGGHTGAVQFVRLGEGAMITAMSGARADVIPWGLVEGPGHLVGLNLIGLRRRGFTKAQITELRQAYDELFFGAGQFRDRLEQIAAAGGGPLVQGMVEFIRAGGNKPLTKARRHTGATDDES